MERAAWMRTGVTVGAGIALAVAAGLACAWPQRPDSAAPDPSGARPARLFAVLPPNSFVPLPPELADATGRVLGRITHYLSVQGRERFVVEPRRTRGLWQASIVEAEVSDSLPHDFDGAMRAFVARLATETPFDALVVPSLVYRQARIQRRRVKWDGAVRRLEAASGETQVPKEFQGAVPAISLHVMVFDAGGALVFENYGGVDLAHALSFDPEKNAVVARLNDEVLGEGPFLNEAVELAFEPYLPRPPSGGW